MIPLARVHLSERWLLVLLAMVQFTHIMDFMIMMPLAPQLMRDLSISATEFSILIAAYTMTAGVIGLLVAPFVDRYDRRTVLVICYAGFILGTWACAASETAGTLMAARAVCGAFGGISNAIILAIVGDLIPTERRGAAMGIIMTAFSAAAAFGVPFGLFLAQTFIWEAPFYFLVAIAAIIEILLLLFLPHVRGHLSQGPPASWKNFRELLASRNAWWGLLLMVTLVFGHFTIIPFLSPHLVFNLKLPESQLALIYILGGLLTVVTAPWIGSLSDRFGRTRVFAVVVSMAVCTILAIMNSGPTHLVVILALSGLFFIFASGRYVPAQAVLASAVPSRQRGAFMSLTACTRDLCSGLAAIFAGRIVVLSADALEHAHWLGWFAAVFSLASIPVIRLVRAVPESTPDDAPQRTGT